MFYQTTTLFSIFQIGIVSSIVNVSGLQNFIFRNYNYPSSVESIYSGSMKYKLWEAIRASSAAPLYYEEFKRDEYIHQVHISRVYLILMTGSKTWKTAGNIDSICTYMYVLTGEQPAKSRY